MVMRRVWLGAPVPVAVNGTSSRSPITHVVTDSKSPVRTSSCTNAPPGGVMRSGPVYDFWPVVKSNPVAGSSRTTRNARPVTLTGFPDASWVNGPDWYDTVYPGSAAADERKSNVMVSLHAAVDTCTAVSNITSDGVGDVCFTTEPFAGVGQTVFFAVVVVAGRLVVVAVVVVAARVVVVLATVVVVVATVVVGRDDDFPPPHAAALTTNPASTTQLSLRTRRP